MRIVFMGTPAFAAIVLKHLLASKMHDVCAVFTAPDAVRSRGSHLETSAVGCIARDADVPLYQPASCKNPQLIDTLAALQPDVICVAAYGMLLPEALLNVARYGAINVHASLLPRWRGAAPIERAILAGDTYAGVCSMRMTAALDAGDFCFPKRVALGELSYDELSEQLACLGAQSLLECLDALVENSVEWQAQDHTLVTYAHKLTKDELYLSPDDTALQACRKVRASSNAHPARALFAGRPVRVMKASVLDDAALTNPLLHERLSSLCAGDMCFHAKRLFLACKSGILEIHSLIPSGKRAMDSCAFASGIQGIKHATLVWESAK